MISSWYPNALIWSQARFLTSACDLLLLAASRVYVSLRIIYPHTYTQYVESGRTEADLMEILNAVHLEYLPAREGGWFTRKEWRDVLSGGEKQRVRDPDSDSS
jgi:hypothetical protein